MMSQLSRTNRHTVPPKRTGWISIDELAKKPEVEQSRATLYNYARRLSIPKNERGEIPVGIESLLPRIAAGFQRRESPEEIWREITSEEQERIAGLMDEIRGRIVEMLKAEFPDNSEEGAAQIAADALSGIDVETELLPHTLGLARIDAVAAIVRHSAEKHLRSAEEQLPVLQTIAEACDQAGKSAGPLWKKLDSLASEACGSTYLAECLLDYLFHSKSWIFLGQESATTTAAWLADLYDRCASLACSANGFLGYAGTGSTKRKSARGGGKSNA